MVCCFSHMNPYLHAILQVVTVASVYVAVGFVIVLRTIKVFAPTVKLNFASKLIGSARDLSAVSGERPLTVCNF